MLSYNPQFVIKGKPYGAGSVLGGGDLVGIFTMVVELGGPDRSRFERIEALVDTESTYSLVPRPVLERLGVRPARALDFFLGDERRVTYDVGEAVLRLLGEEATILCIFGEPDAQPLLGAHTLETFSLAVDPVNQRLIRVPGLLK